jgi:hypothetical protein
MRVRAPDITHTARAATLWFGLAALAPIAAAGDDGAPPRPNILWIVAEDMGPELGCFGTSQVHTPHLDRLAAQGVRFTRAFTTAPVCSASRSAFMTGMYQTTIGAHRSSGCDPTDKSKETYRGRETTSGRSLKVGPGENTPLDGLYPADPTFPVTAAAFVEPQT